jgi:phage virion morphogenesis protein
MIEIQLDDRELRAALQRLGQVVGDLTPALHDIGADLVARVDLGFTDGADPYGNPWEALKPSTVAKRRKGSNVPLRDTGNLANSFTYNVIGDVLEVGTNVPYAPTHQRGAAKGAYGRTRRNAPIPWGDIPARPMLPDATRGLPDEWRESVLNIVQRHIEDALK